MDDVVSLLSRSGDGHVWEDRVRDILEVDGSEWTDILQETLQKAAQSKAMLPMYQKCAAIIEKGNATDASIEELIGAVKDLLKLRNAMRRGATKQLEKTCYSTLYRYCHRILDKELPLQSLGTLHMRKLITAMGLLSNHEGCNEAIARLRELMANCKTDVAAGELLDMASEAGTDDVDWQVL